MVPALCGLGTEKKTPYPESLYLSDMEPEHGQGYERRTRRHIRNGDSVFLTSEEHRTDPSATCLSALPALGIAIVQFLVEFHSSSQPFNPKLGRLLAVSLTFFSECLFDFARLCRCVLSNWVLIEPFVMYSEPMANHGYEGFMSMSAEFARVQVYARMVVTLVAALLVSAANG